MPLRVFIPFYRHAHQMMPSGRAKATFRLSDRDLEVPGSYCEGVLGWRLPSLLPRPCKTETIRVLRRKAPPCLTSPHQHCCRPLQELPVVKKANPAYHGGAKMRLYRVVQVQAAWADASRMPGSRAAAGCLPATSSACC